MELKHYVEEVWTELDYEKGLNKRKITLPIKNRDNYIALPWVRKYKFFDIDKDNNKRNITTTIANKNYNPLYFMDNQSDMIEEHKVDLEIVHYIRITLMEREYFSEKLKEREIVLPIKNRESYIPTLQVKEYSFVDYLKISIDGKVIVDKTPLNESITYINPIFNDLYLSSNSLIDKKNFETKGRELPYKSNIRTLNRKNIKSASGISSN